MPHTGKHTRSGTPLRRGTAMLAQQELHNSTEDQNDSATGINQADLNSMAAHAARVRFADNLEAGWRFDVSDNLNDWPTGWLPPALTTRCLCLKFVLLFLCL